MLVKTFLNEYSDYEYYDIGVSGMLTSPDSVEREIMDEVAKDLSDYFEVTVSEVRGLFSPYMVDSTSSKLLYQLAAGAGYALIFVFVVLIAFTFFDIADYRRNKYYKKLAPGDPEGAATINEAVSKDIERERYIINRKGFMITDGWVIQTAARSFSIKRRSDLIWAYASVTQHRTNGIPSGKTHAVILAFRDKQLLTVTTKNEADSSALMETLRQHSERVLFGYSDELFRMFQKDFEHFLLISSQDDAYYREPDSEGDDEKGPELF